MTVTGSSEDRVCLTCRRPVSEHKGFTCPTPAETEEVDADDLSLEQWAREITDE